MTARLRERVSPRVGRELEAIRAFAGSSPSHPSRRNKGKRIAPGSFLKTAPLQSPRTKKGATGGEVEAVTVDRTAVPPPP